MSVNKENAMGLPFQQRGREYARAWAMLGFLALIAGMSLALTRWIPEVPPAGRPNETVKATTPPGDLLERLIVEKVEGHAPGDDQVWQDPSFQLQHGLSDDELREFRRDPQRVVDRLLRTVSGEGDERHRQKVLRALGIYVGEVEGLEQPRRLMHRGVELLASGTVPLDLETDLVSDLARRSQSVGMEAADKAALRDRARAFLHQKLPHPDYAKVWALSLAQLGGPEDKEIILGAWDSLDQNGRSMLLETALIGPKGP